MASNVEVNLTAKVSDFETALNKANNAFNKFAETGGNVNTVLKKGFKELSDAGKNSVDDLQKTFNGFGVKSDIAIKFNMKYVEEAKATVEKMFSEFRKDGVQSASEMSSAFRQLQLMLGNIDSAVLGNEFKQLGIQSAASIEVMRNKTIAAFEEIERQGTKYPQDIIRAREAMNVELRRLDDLLITDAGRAAAEKLKIEAKLVNDRIRLDNERKLAFERNQLEEIENFKRLKASETSMYAAQAMSGKGSAAQLIGQPLAGSEFANQLKSQMEESVQSAKSLNSHMQGVQQSTSNANTGVKEMNMSLVASIGTIAKMQIMFSLINTTLASIGKMPGLAIDAITDYSNAIVKNAAIITSMGGETKDLVASYKQNKEYAESVQVALVGMSKSTISSAAQLQLMNNAFVLQGVYIDANNKKQVEGYKNIADFLSTMSKGMSNPDMQFGQEIRALMNGEDKATNTLFRTLKSMDPELKQHLEDWKQIARETGNAGYVLEKIGPLLQGFAAANGDISAMWDTIKTNMVSIRDQILRGGLSEGFSHIVTKMKEMADYAEVNKDKIQAFLRNGFAEAENVASVFGLIGKAVYELGQPLIWAGITAGIYTAVSAMSKLAAEMTIASGGVNLLIAGAISLGVWGGKQIASIKELNNEASSINGRMQAHANQGGIRSTPITGEQVGYLKSQYPLITENQIIEGLRSSAIKVKDLNAVLDSEINGPVSAKNRMTKGVDVDKDKIAALLSPKSNVKPPLPPKGDGAVGEADTERWNSFVGSFNSLLNKTEIDPFVKKLEELDDTVNNVKNNFRSMTAAEQAESNKQDAGFGGTIKAIDKAAEQSRTRILLEQQNATYSAKLGALKAFTKNEEETIKQAALYEQEINKINYNTGLIDLKTYLDKKHNFSETALQDEMNAQQELIQKNIASIGNVVNSGGSEIKFEEARKKAAESTLKLIDLQGRLIILKQADSDETRVSMQSENAKFVSTIAGLQELSGQYINAAKAKDAFYRTTDDYKKLSPEMKALHDKNFSETITQAGFKENNFKAGGTSLDLSMTLGANPDSFDAKYAIERDTIEKNYQTRLEQAESFYGKDEALRAKFENAKFLAQKEKDAQLSKLNINSFEKGFAFTAQNLDKMSSLMMKGNKEQFEAGKKFAIASAILNTFIAASAAFKGGVAAAPGPWGVALGIASAAIAVTAGMAQVAAIEGTQYQAREMGGPVTAGQSYIVGEKRPELFTPGASGVITPYVPQGGSGVTMTNVYQISTGVADTVRAEVMRLAPALAQMSINAVSANINSGGSLAASVGRR